MITNTAFAAALTTFLIVAWLAGELSYLAPYKFALFRYHAQLIGSAVLLVFLNLCAIYYSISRWLFLRDTGQKLHHLDQQLVTADTAIDASVTPIPALNVTTHLLARRLNGSVWSASNDVTIIANPELQLKITELNYNPYAPASGPYTAQDFEFVELQNDGVFAGTFFIQFFS